jgi:hypothetical protein
MSIFKNFKNWFKTPAELAVPEPVLGSVSLILRMIDGDTRSWARVISTPCENEADYFDYYKKFTEWYKNYPNEYHPDAFFVMRYKNGETMFKHKDIKRYEITYVVPEVRVLPHD